MSKNLSTVLKGTTSIVLPLPGNTGNVLTSTGNTWTSSAPAASGVSATKTISNITGAYTVVAGDLGKIINCTSGTFTITTQEGFPFDVSWPTV
jgi:hypothetical protein